MIASSQNYFSIFSKDTIFQGQVFRFVISHYGNLLHAGPPPLRWTRIHFLRFLKSQTLVNQ